MSRSTKVVVKRGGLALGLTATALAAVSYVQTIVRIDPFAPLKEANREIDPTIGVRLDGVKLESYEKDKLVTTASIDRMDVRQDRNHYDLWQVRDGIFRSDKGALNFDAPHAIWSVSGHQLEAPEGGRVKDKNVDLAVGKFKFLAGKGEMNTSEPVTGKFFKGDIKANGVRYNVNDGSYSSGPLSWTGSVNLGQGQLGQSDQQSPRVWKITSEKGMHHLKNDVDVYDDATATDDDIFVKADLIEHDNKTDIVTATGNVRYLSSKTNMVCEKAVIERQIKKAVLTGKVQMLIKAKANQDKKPSLDEGIPPYRPFVPEDIASTRPKPEAKGQTDEEKKLDDQIRNGKNARDYPTICYADRIEYWYKKGERHAIITGKPQARQELSGGAWRQVVTTTGLYDGEKETLKMQSAPGKQDTHFMNSIGDDGLAEWVLMSTKEDDESYDAWHFTALLVDKSDEIPRDKPKVKLGDKGANDKGTGTGGTGTGTGTGGTGGTGGGAPALKGQIKKKTTAGG